MSLLIPILLLGLGIALIVAEVLIPSMGILSLMAAASLIGSVATAFTIDSATGIQFLVAVAVLGPLALLLGMKLFPRSPVGRRMMLGGLSFDSKAATDDRDIEMAGRRGVVEAPLRPAGIARIEGRRVDVVSRGEVLDRGTPVEVIEVQGNRVVVRAVEAPAPGAGQPAPADGTE